MDRTTRGTGILLGIVAVAVAVAGLGAAPASAGGGGAVTAPWDAARAAGIHEVSKSWSLAARDLDGDGWPDLLFGRHGGAARLYRNDGGVFVEVAPRSLPARDRHDCAWGDVNADGRDDLYCSVGARKGTTAKPAELWIQGPGMTFVERARRFGVADRYGRGRRVTFVDANGDRYPDLFVGNAARRKDGVRAPNRLFLNRQGRRFVDVDTGVREAIGASCARAVDADRDGWEDLLVCGKFGLVLYRNDRGRRFVDETDGLGARARAVSAVVADVAGSPRPELLTLGRRDLALRPGRAGGFGPPRKLVSVRMGQWLETGDADGDGDLDVFVVQSCRGGVDRPDFLLRNDGAGTFTRVDVPAASEGCGHVAEAIDHDRDGRDDFVVANGRGQHTPPGPVQLITWSDGPRIGTLARRRAATATGPAAPRVVCLFDREGRAPAPRSHCHRLPG